MSEYFQGSNTCRNMFPSPCGSLNVNLLTLKIDLQNIQYVAGWLQTIGISNIQTLLGSLSVTMNALVNPTLVTWNVDIFPELEVIRNGLSAGGGEGSQYTILPGIGFGKLRVTQSISLTGRGAMQNTDLAFLSSLECPGQAIRVEGLSTLTSLRGLERVVDSSPTLPPDPADSCWLKTYDSIISNVSALATYARCGADQRPDSDNNRLCLRVPCGDIDSWGALCNYNSRGTCT
jgi:hypothetical protein